MHISNKYENKITLNFLVSQARRRTADAAIVKDYRCRNKHNRRMREIAREWNADKGYRICSIAELKAEYGDLVHYHLAGDARDNKKRVWGIIPPFIRPYRIDFLAFC